jgi:hypothetical protein
MKSKKKINAKALTEYTKHLFSLTQVFPPSILALLTLKTTRELSDKEYKEIY